MRKNGLRVKGCGFKISSVHYSPFSTRHSLSVTLPICRLHDLPISFGRANFLVSPIWVRGAECGCQAKIFGNAGALPHKTTRYSLFAIRCRFGFNWRVVLQHDRNLNKFGCSGEQPSSFVPAGPKFFGTAEPCPPEKPFAIRHSPFATRYSPSFGLSGACDQDL
jgi:hypothetical protein